VPPELDALVMDLCEIDREQRTANGAEAYSRFAALTGSCAPFPAGQHALAEAVEEVLATEARPDPDASSERATEVQPRRGEREATSGKDSRPRKATPVELPRQDGLSVTDPEKLRTESGDKGRARRARR
jgi:hypothetical protein